MSNLADAIELMHLAHETAATIRAEVLIRRHSRLTQLAWQRWQASQASYQDDPASVPLTAAEFIVERYVVQTQRPGWRWRIERRTGDGIRLTVINGKRFWLEIGPHHETYTNEGESNPADGRDPDQLVADMFDSSAPLTLFRLTHEGEESVLGRRTHRLRGLPKHHGEADDYRRSWYYADAHVLWIDTDYGILLRYEAYLGDEMMAQSELTSVVFNEPIDPSMFVG